MRTTWRATCSASIAALPKWALIGLGLILIILIGALDYMTGTELSCAVFYLLPVVFVAWYGSARWGIFMSCISAVVWFIMNTVTQQALSTHLMVQVWNALTRLGSFLIVTKVLSLFRQALEREHALARTDILTGTFNSRAFHEMVEFERQRAQRYQHPLTMLYIDADNFKDVNDQWGHQTGDKVLQRIAETLKHSLRGTDVTARLGGDEFAVLLPEASPEAAQMTARKLRDRLLETMGQSNWPVTFSIGALTFIQPPDTVDAMIAEADMLMYAVKRDGKNALKYEIAVTP